MVNRLIVSATPPGKLGRGEQGAPDTPVDFLAGQRIPGLLDKHFRMLNKLPDEHGFIKTFLEVKPDIKPGSESFQFQQRGRRLRPRRLRFQQWWRRLWLRLLASIEAPVVVIM